MCSWLEAHNFKRPEISTENLNIWKDQEKVLAEMNKGKHIFQILGLSEEAIASFYHAAHQLTEEGDFINGYLNALHLYLQSKETGKAIALSEQGINFAKSHSQEPWSQELIETLLEAKKLITAS